MTICPGCGYVSTGDDGSRDTLFHASSACRAKFDELSFYTLALGDEQFSHQHAVDAYEAQHIGPDSKPIMAPFALIGLYLLCERGFDGRQVQRAHTLMAANNRDWPTFVPPRMTDTFTVADVLTSERGLQRASSIRQWASSVWFAWRGQHDAIRALATERLG